MRRALIGGGLLAGLGGLVLAGALFAGGGSPRGWIDGRYQQLGAGSYRAGQPPARVASDLVRRHRPSDRVYDPAGIFLRYRDDVVVIAPDGRGSRVTVLDPDRAYRTYHGYVGGRWGGFNGRASTFRGGGPGTGK
ncbi:DUF4247 domain-containing protein [Actinomadura flavalba]|uniref:DUF4247 domain-containing protein n=1 Tax=Actinomadura flavalba TaxID=1120938 RepID=UPI000364684D|nr:DUF4247 domain-containing protein [Actinomadura flavalba]